MHNENEIINFGHDPIPVEIYEDYKQMERLNRFIEETINNTNYIAEEKKAAIRELLLSMHNNFEKMSSKMLKKSFE